MIQLIKNADFTDRGVWLSILQEVHNKLCVWFNVINFGESVVKRFQDIAMDLMIDPRLNTWARSSRRICY